jgi:quercetin dioxygenase-like cupin family protein
MKGKSMSYFNNPQEKQSRLLAPGVHARPFWGDSLMLVAVELESHSEVPSHSHPQEQAGTVLSGEIEFTIAGQHKTLHAGDMYFIPGNIEHSAKTGNSPARVMDIFTPLRQDFMD